MTEELLMVIGVVFVVCGLGALANPAFFRKTMGNFTDNPALVYLAGVVNLIIGIFLIMNHNLWGSLPEIIVSFFGWAATLRGVIMLLSPKFFLKLFKSIWMGSHLKGEAIFLLIIGMIFIYLSM